jgi:hypothetical protein
MLAVAQMKEDTDRLELPWDLGEWVSREMLLAWIDQNLDSLDWGNPELVKYLAERPDYQPRQMLRLIGLAYAVGLFESEEIASNTRVDPVFRSVGGNVPLASREILRFRRENRSLIKWLLAQVLNKAFRERFELGSRLLPSGLRRYLEQNAVERIDLARHVDRAAIEE